MASKYKRCPSCAEQIQEKAKVCRYCGANVKRDSPWRLIAFILLGIFFYQLCDFKGSPEHELDKSLRAQFKEMTDHIPSAYLANGALEQRFDTASNELKDLILDSLASEFHEQITESKKREARENNIKNQFSAWDGSHIKLKRATKEALHDPDSFEHIQTSWEDKGDHILVHMEYRGKNAFGGIVKNWVRVKADVESGSILEVVGQG